MNLRREAFFYQDLSITSSQWVWQKLCQSLLFIVISGQSCYTVTVQITLDNNNFFVLQQKGNLP